MQAVVRRVDHINVRVPDPRALFSFLTETLELPVAWPWRRFPGFASGGAALGINLEPVAYAPGRRVRAPEDGGLYAIAFEPEPIHTAAKELARRRIPHSAPLPYIGRYPDGADTTVFHRRDPHSHRSHLWTLVGLGGFLGDTKLARDYSRLPLRGDSRVGRLLARLAGGLYGSDRFGDLVAATTVSDRPFLFLCEYHGFNVAESRELAAQELASRGGGPLGLRRVAEIVVEARDVSAETSRWRRLLEPAPEIEPGRWQLADGPSLCVVEGAHDHIAALVLEVESLDEASSWLHRKGWLAMAGGAVAIASVAVQGLDLRCAEPTSH
ncbi:MAG: VOC family protein [Solirubrobacterales bacterium]